MENLNPKWITKSNQTRLYELPIPIIGLTGGIATGKSTVANFLRNKNFPIIDADALVKKIYQKAEVKEFIKNNFPIAIQTDEINFKILRELAFKDKQNIQKIEECIYRFLPTEFKETYHTFTNPNFIIYDVPLLFEKHLNLLVDTKICVYAPKEIQIERLMKRDHIERDVCLKILDNQMSIEDKKQLSDIVIKNDSTLDQLIQRTEIAILELTKK
jgi:dephospho-CoA kinase